MTFDPIKRRAMDLAIASLDKRFGKGTLTTLNTKPLEVQVISTGCMAIDLALGVGGIPKGRITELYGPEGGGKSSLALHMVAIAQRTLTGACAYIDAEHALDTQYAKNLGVSVEDLFIAQPGCGEEALEITEALIRTGATDLIIVDSVAALVPRDELAGEMGDSLPGKQARLMSQALRKLTAVVARSNTCLVFINQIRSTIGGSQWGPNETTTGGRALKFYASVRMDIRRIGSVKDGEQVIGAQTRLKVVKNKVAPPFREAIFELIYGKGISGMMSVLDLAVEHKIIEKSGAWFSYKGNRLGQGREKARETLDSDAVLQAEIREAVMASVAIQQAEKSKDTQKSGAVS